MKRARLNGFPMQAATILALVGTPALAEPASPAWREAFGSSPAAYPPLAPEVERNLVERFKLPPAILEQMKAKPPIAGTLRYRIAVTAAGSQLRIRLSNEEGAEPLNLTSVTVGLAGQGFGAQAGSIQPVSFSKARSVQVAGGAPVLSDPVALAVRPGTELIVSINTAGKVSLDPRGGGGVQTAEGDQTMREELSSPVAVTGRPLVTGVLVLTDRPTKVIATFGDSITDGNRATASGTLRGWPEELARRLAARSHGGRYAVVNAGIGGNRLLTPGWGAAGLARLDRDVLRIEGLSHLIVVEGTNDIGMSGNSPIFGPGPSLTPQDLINGYRQVIARAHVRNVKVVIGTITPFGGSFSHFTAEKEKMRQAVNDWIRRSGEPDAVIDFDAITRSAETPDTFSKGMGSTDRLHPGDAGYKAMGDAIDLSLFP